MTKESESLVFSADVAVPSLRPCPFCGAEAIEFRWLDQSLYGADDVEYLQIKCSNYCCAGLPSEHHAQSVEVWNRRA